MKSLLKSSIRRMGYHIERTHPAEKAAIVAYDRYHDFTMIPRALYLDNLKLVYNFRHVPGCVVECGVWRGGMIAGIASMFPKRHYYLFDSFEGLPPAQEIDGARALAWQNNPSGESYYDNCRAEMNFAEEAMKTTAAKFNIVKGWFQQTLPVAEFSDEIAVLRLDADWYDSTYECLKNLYPRVAVGGIIILDDYYTWDGCSRAVHDYLSGNSLPSRIHKTSLGTPYVVKKE